MISKRFWIFISSVQKELAAERDAVKDYLLTDPLLKRYVADVYLIEDTPAQDQRAETAYINEVDRSDIYLGIFGNEYGNKDDEGLSPTEREFNRATATGKYRLIFVKGQSDKDRKPEMIRLIRKASNQLVRKRFTDIQDLKSLIYASMIDFLDQRGMLRVTPFDATPCDGASLRSISQEKVTWFIKLARVKRGFPLNKTATLKEVLQHLNLLEKGHPTNSAILLFSNNPQHYLPNSEIKCCHFHTTDVRKPIPSYQIFKGDIFDQADQAVDFILSKLTRTIGTRAQKTQAPVEYEIPREAIAEAVINAIAHRDYTDNSTVQVMSFVDRVEVWNPGQLPQGLTPDLLRKPHPSIPHNPLIAEPLYLAHYIEKIGTGTLDMIARCRKVGLPEPDFEQRGNQFVVTLWRTWITDEILKQANINERQKKAILFVKTNGRITNRDYQKLTGAIKKTATRDLEVLVKKGLLKQIGKTGRGVYYIFSKMGTKRGKMGHDDNEL